MLRTYGGRSYVYDNLRVKNNSYAKYVEEGKIRTKIGKKGTVLYNLGDVYNCLVERYPRLKDLKSEINFVKKSKNSNKSKKSKGVAGYFTDTQIGSINATARDIDDYTVENSAILGEISQNLGKLTLMNEKATKEFKNSGRLVDVTEAETYARKIIRDMVKNIMDLPKSDTVMNAEFDMTLSECTRILEWVSNHLMEVFRGMEEEIEEYTEGFIAKVLSSSGYASRTKSWERESTKKTDRSGVV